MTSPVGTGLIDITGQKFNRWHVLGPSHRDEWRQWHWYCRCQCGTERVVNGKDLRYGKSTSCGCHGREAASARRSVDLVGQTFGRWTVTARGRISNGHQVWSLACTCGNTGSATTGSLRSGNSKSCGCLKAEVQKRPRPDLMVTIPKYAAMHLRVVSARGKASQHTCVDCGDQPSTTRLEWAYDHEDPDEVIEMRRARDGSMKPVAYSLDVAHFIVRCADHHREFDITWAQRSTLSA